MLMKFKKGTGWGYWDKEKGLSFCRNCHGKTQCKPKDNCSDNRHMNAYLGYKKQRLPKLLESNFNLKRKALEIIGLKCIRCNETNLLLLEINHIKAVGIKGREDDRHLYWKVVKGLRSINDLETRCANCNVLYEYERGRRYLPEEYKYLLEQKEI